MTTRTSEPSTAAVTCGTSPRADRPTRTTVSSRSLYRLTRSGSKAPNEAASSQDRSVLSIPSRVSEKLRAMSTMEVPIDDAA